MHRLFAAGLLCLLMFSFQTSTAQKLIAAALAKRHSFNIPKPAPDFFEGALLGNGGLGVVVTTRPDAVVLYLGHNDVWDIRIAEDHREKIGKFKDVFERVRKIPSELKNLSDDPWYDQHNKLTADNYSKPYPRPFPCGSIVLGFDRRKNRLLGHELDISNGLCRIRFINEHQQTICLEIFVSLEKDDMLLSLNDGSGNAVQNIFNRVRIITDPSTPAEFPVAQLVEDLSAGLLSFRQVLPSQQPAYYRNTSGHDKDKAFSLQLQSALPLSKQSRMNWNNVSEQMAPLEAELPAGKGFSATVSLRAGLASETPLQQKKGPYKDQFADLLKKNTLLWSTYWNRSAVQLQDPFLEQIWYRNLYFLNCVTRPDATCPGIFGNWSYNNIGTAWHGDYHMNYNTQQPFWVSFSSNHLEKNLPYVNLVEHLLPVSKRWARDYYEMPGAYFPHSAYPVEMTMNPYPVPDWGWEISETPWTVQGLWWHYLYSGDTSFLRNRAFGPLKAAVEFLVAYLQRPEATDSNYWGDHAFHVFPTVPPELYGLQPGFKLNYDCSVDISLIKFAFNAYNKAVRLLGIEDNEKQLLARTTLILANLPAYPTAQSKEYGQVLVSVPGERPDVVYNVPIPLFPVFPAEDTAFMSKPANHTLLKNTYYNQRNEGGNDLVMINLQAARLGLLDLEKFKQQVKYCLLPNGTATDMVMQVHGRYSDNTDFAYMKRMGIWIENFALPAVINESLMQSYTGTIRLFPNWPRGKDAAFDDLRAAGAFLVSARQKNGVVEKVMIKSEAGGDLLLTNPWPGKTVIMQSEYGKKVFKTTTIKCSTRPGEVFSIIPAS